MTEQLVGGQYARGIGDDDTWSYSYKLNDGQEYNINEIAMCGFNSDGMRYCPKRRHISEYQDLNRADQFTWNTFIDLNCHFNSTVQYCSKIEENRDISLAYRNAIRNEFDVYGYYPFIANCDKWVGEAIEFTAYYFNLLDSNNETMLEYSDNNGSSSYLLS